jgi:hypothetical protein
MNALEKLSDGYETNEWDYGGKDMNAVRILKDRLRKTGEREELITYSKLVHNVPFSYPTINKGEPFYIEQWNGFERHLIGDVLAYISMDCYSNHKILPNVLVVDSAEVRPSRIFFNWMKKKEVIPNTNEDTINQFWITELISVYDWYTKNRKQRKINETV